MSLYLQVMDAVGYLHSMNIVHRDLKPENILLTGSTDATEVKITDFGLAKRTNQEGLKTFCGTPQYFAPEVLRRKAPADSDAMRSSYGHKADVWSIGVITYIMLSGSFPFDDDRLFDQIEHAQYSLSGAEWSTVSPLAKHFIRSLMNLDIQQRLDINAAMRHPWIEEYRTTAALPPPVPIVRAASLPTVLQPEEGCTNGRLITPEKVVGSSPTGDIVADELLQLQRTSHLGGDGSLGVGEAAKPTIFWSNKAALVKLASIRKRVSSGPGALSSPAAPDASVEGGGKSVREAGPHALTPQQAGRPLAAEPKAALVVNDLTKSNIANDTPIKPDPSEIKAPVTTVAKGSKRRRRKGGTQLEGRVLSDDDIDCFSEDELSPAPVVTVQGGSVEKSKPKGVKRSRSSIGASSKPRVAIKKDSIKVIKDSESGPDGLPLKQLEMGAHVPSQPIVRQLSATSGRRATTGGKSKADAGSGSRCIESYFSKNRQRVLRAPIHSISAAFVENKHDSEDGGK